jgi:hypothetical protein
MVANNGSQPVKDMVRSHPDRIGWIMGPSNWKNPIPGIVYALDNDAFVSWTRGTPWDERAWLRMLDRAAAQAIPPIWCLVPDVVADRVETLRRWDRHSATVERFGFARAFAVQDGMTPADVPTSASVVFVGGTTAWKWRNLSTWSRRFPRVHVGRVRQSRLMECARLGVESVDGTGWFREGKTGRPARFLRAYVEGHMTPHPELFCYEETS